MKLGHGGTLDPMATGVLIVGVGKGTKHLQGFLECTKAYEAVVIFGAATDTYDVLGRVLGKAPYAHVDREGVEGALQKGFCGQIMQRPPLYSALRMDGKRLYEYAREGKEIPRGIEERPVEVKNIGIVAWLAGGTHEFTWPSQDASSEEKRVANDVLHLPHDQSATKGTSSDSCSTPNVDATAGIKRKRSISPDADNSVPDGLSASKRQETGSLVNSPISVQPKIESNLQQSRSDGVGNMDISLPQEEGPPAAQISMTVTSGFYVRSLCHDLGQAVGSLGIMAALVRKRQGDFELGRNVMEYDDFSKGEDLWAPKLQQMLNAWKDEQSTAP